MKQRLNKDEPTKEVVKEVSEPQKASSVNSNEVIAYAETFLGNTI